MTHKFERLSVELGDDTSTAKGALLITHFGNHMNCKDYLEDMF